MKRPLWVKTDPSAMGAGEDCLLSQDLLASGQPEDKWQEE
jgi:hypothetical protein